MTKEKTVYHTLISASIKDMKDKIKRVRKLDAAIKLAEEILPEFANIWIDYEVNCDWAAKSMTEIKMLLKEFAKRKAMLDHFVESDSNPTWYLKLGEVKIRLCPRWSTEEGASCRLIKIGESVNIYPKYKLVCDNTEVTT